MGATSGFRPILANLDNLAKLQRHPPRPVVLRPLRQLSRPALQIPPKQAYFSSV